MPRTDAKKTYKIMDMWQSYVSGLLAANPEWWTKYAHDVSNFVIYRKAGNRVEEVMDYHRYAAIVRAYFTRAKKAIINGEALDMLGRVGKICALRVERDFRKEKQRMVDWPRTREQPLVWDEQAQRMKYKNVIYYTTDDWCRIGWRKSMYIANESVYEFRPSAASGDRKFGFKLEFSQALKADPLLKYQYLFSPVRNVTYKSKRPVKHEL